MTCNRRLHVAVCHDSPPHFRFFDSGIAELRMNRRSARNERLRVGGVLSDGCRPDRQNGCESQSRTQVTGRSPVHAMNKGPYAAQPYVIDFKAGQSFGERQSGVTTIRACFQPVQNLRARTQKSLSSAAIRGLGRVRLSTASCCRRTRFSSRRFRRVRKTRSIAPVRSAIMENMSGSYRSRPVSSNDLSC